MKHECFFHIMSLIIINVFSLKKLKFPPNLKTIKISAKYHL